MTGIPNTSIILPVYSGEKHLRKCLDSVLAQTYGDCVLIIWDEVPWDDSCKILRSYHVPG
jgi:GT2 family glycosyltransferase